MIRNKTKKTVIGERYELCRGFFSKASGLMFKLSPKILVFEFDKEKINSLHMFFVFFPIDVLFLDKNKKVVEVKKNFMPFHIYTPKKKSMYVIELPLFTLDHTKTQAGDILDF